MSIKGFLEAKEMQTGGMLQQSFTGPFANQSRRDPSGAEYIPPTYAPPKPPTITIDPITPTPTAPTAEEIAQLDPGNVGSHADYNYSVTDAIAGAAKAGMGPFTPAQIGMLEPAFAASLAATVQPETDLSRGLDKFALGVVAPVVATTLGTAFPPLGIAGAAMSKAGVIGSKDGIISTLFGGGKPAATTTPASQAAALAAINQTPATQTSAKPTSSAYLNIPGNYGKFSQNPAAPTVSESVSLDYATPTSTSQITPIASEFGPMGGGYLTPGSETVNTFSGTTGMSAAQAGSEMFGNIYGMGGEVSPNFAIGGSGSYTSFAHYGAGISQADEISIVSNAAPGLFSSASEGKDVVDGLVGEGFTESEIGQAIADFGAYGSPGGIGITDVAEGGGEDGTYGFAYGGQVKRN